MRFTTVFTLFMAGQALAGVVAPQADAALEARTEAAPVEARDDVPIEAREVLEKRRKACEYLKVGDRCVTGGKWGTCRRFHTGLSCRT